ncbi:MAG TPA: hypothetical protein PLJ22_01635 [Kiritimatiellia bacterium]|nr:hypothetical protein [Kiritimatiellia bacterium]
MKRFLMVGLFLFTTAVMARAFQFENLHHLETPPYQPEAALTQGPDRRLWGTTCYGGTHDCGAIFKSSTNGGYATVWNFTGGPDGSFPQAALLLASDTNLYGTTSAGGTGGAGVIFRITSAGVLTVLHSFSGGTGGSSPCGGLIQGADKALYGITTYGGNNSCGTVFKITTNGTFTQLWSFTGGDDGATPYGKLVQGPDFALYGTCSRGGSNDWGTVFRITTSGAMKPLWSFTKGADGAQPFGGLAAGTNGVFVGQTYSGGNNGYGTIFNITTNGTLTSLVSFNQSNGANPRSGLIRATNGFFYGTTQFGGHSGKGIIYKIGQHGGMTTLWSLDPQTEGSEPNSALFQMPSGAFYGVSPRGGAYDTGTMFEYLESAEDVKCLRSFPPAPMGREPSAALVQGSDGAFYGTALWGGTNNFGTIFKLDTNGVVSCLWPFTGGDDGANPGAELLPLPDDGGLALYGTTQRGGISNCGTAFVLYSDGTGNAYSFTNSPSDGNNPRGGLVRGPDQAFYGSTYLGGISNKGTIYRIATNGEESLLYSFRGTDGANPRGTLAVASNGVFYGVTERGGANDMGTLFRITTNGVFTTLWNFSGDSDGGAPRAGVILARDGHLYGTTVRGGIEDAGTIYRITTNGVITILHSGSWGPNGGRIQAPLVQGRDGNLYGTTLFGGDNDCGVIFRITTDGVFTRLWSFAGGIEGGLPQAGLIEAGNWFYGTTPMNNGTIFRFSMGPALTTAGPSGLSARVLLWDQPGFQLQSTTNALGPYTTLLPVATSPYTNKFNDRLRFFRLRQE